MVSRIHWALIALVVIACAPLQAQTVYYSAGTHSMPRSGGSGTSPYYGWTTDLSTALGGGATGNGPDLIRTFPNMTSPYTVYWCTANSMYDLPSRKPLVTIRSEVVGSGIPPRKGVYQDIGGEWLPVDQDGVPFDPETGEDLPGIYKDGFEVENPFADRPFSFDLVMTDPDTGEVLSEGTYTLGPGATMPFDLAADRPYDWAVYPHVDGVRSPTPYQSGSGSYGGGGSGGSSGGPGTVGGPPLMNNDGPYTNPLPSQPAAPTGDVQAEVRRLADIVEDSQDAARTAANLNFDQLQNLNGKAATGNEKLGQIADGIQAANGLLAGIEANTGATADNTAGGASGGMTQAEFEESLDGSGLVVDPITPGSDADGVALVNAVLSLKTSLEGLADSVTINAPAGSTSLAFAVPTPAGTVSIDLEPYATWFSIVRAVFLFLAVLWFFNAMTETLRSAVS